MQSNSTRVTPCQSRRIYPLDLYAEQHHDPNATLIPMKSKHATQGGRGLPATFIRLTSIWNDKSFVPTT